MTIVIGRGKKRMTVIVPCAAIVKASSEQDQTNMVHDFCTLAWIKGL